MEDIVRFLSVNSGSEANYGFGSGDGFGSGYGSGYGFGDGYGSENDSGFGSGDGFGDGRSYGCEGIKTFCGLHVSIINQTQTVIFAIKGNFARGAILRSDLFTVPCWIAKRGDFFAHGKTIHSAFEAAEAKYRQHLPIEDRIKAFVAAHPDPDAAYGDLFEWHNTLTGSCEFGRREWCARNGLRPDDSLTLKDFFRMTKNEYGGEVIRRVEKMYLQPGNCRKD